AHYEGGREYPLQPLNVPEIEYKSIEKLQTNPAVKLFLTSANFHEHDKPVLELTEQTAKTVAAICRYYIGLPLAIILAASWVKELGIKDVEIMLLTGELLTLEKSLYNLIKRSYQLLNKKEQRIYRRLTTFGSGGCSAKTAQTVCNFGDLYMDENSFLK